jgi:hypothetical protein
MGNKCRPTRQGDASKGFQRRWHQLIIVMNQAHPFIRPGVEAIVPIFHHAQATVVPPHLHAWNFR